MVVVTMKMIVVTRMVLPTVIYRTSPVSAEITRDQQKFRGSLRNRSISNSQCIVVQGQVLNIPDSLNKNYTESLYGRNPSQWRMTTFNIVSPQSVS